MRNRFVVFGMLIALLVMSIPSFIFAVDSFDKGKAPPGITQQDQTIEEFFVSGSVIDVGKEQMFYENVSHKYRSNIQVLPRGFTVQQLQEKNPVYISSDNNDASAANTSYITFTIDKRVYNDVGQLYESYYDQTILVLLGTQNVQHIQYNANLPRGHDRKHSVQPMADLERLWCVEDLLHR